MAIIIRPAHGKDQLTILRKLHKECLPGSPLGKFATGWWWIAWDGSKPVGFCGMYASHQWLETGYLCRAGVIREYRGKGLQKRLIRVRVAKAKELNWHYVISDTRTNPASANSLISCGFKTYKPRKPWSFRDATYWRKTIINKERAC